MSWRNTQFSMGTSRNVYFSLPDGFLAWQDLIGEGQMIVFWDFIIIEKDFQYSDPLCWWMNLFHFSLVVAGSDGSIKSQVPTLLQHAAGQFGGKCSEYFCLSLRGCRNIYVYDYVYCIRVIRCIGNIIDICLVTMVLSSQYCHVSHISA